jgi:hypothetical protein
MADKRSPLGNKIRLRILQSQHGFEDLDLRRKWPDGKRRADYARLLDPQIVLEQKDIMKADARPMVDLMSHIDQCIRKYTNRAGNEHWSPADRSRFFLLEKKALRKFEDYFRLANYQIADTREVLGIVGAAGLLVIVNQYTAIAPDAFCLPALQRVLFDDSGSGGLRHPNVEGCIYVQKSLGRIADRCSFAVLDGRKPKMLARLVDTIVDDLTKGLNENTHWIRPQFDGPTTGDDRG